MVDRVARYSYDLGDDLVAEVAFIGRALSADDVETLREYLELQAKTRRTYEMRAQPEPQGGAER